MRNVVMVADGREFNLSARQAAALDILAESKKGGFARIKGYVSKSDRTIPEVANITALTRISMDKLYTRKIDAMNALTFDQIVKAIPSGSRLAKLDAATLLELFEDRRRELIDSLSQTLVGDRSDARRIAHDTFYANVDSGVKVHFKTEKSASGTKLVRDAENGHPIVESIMVTYIPISKDVISEGEYKVVNSRNNTLMGHVIDSLLPRSVKVRVASLKEDNFAELIIDGETMMPDDIAGRFT